MLTLATILSAANRVMPEGGTTVTSSTGGQPASESFDQVMARTLSPSESDATTGSELHETVPTVSGKVMQNTLFTPVQRRHLSQARNTTSEETAHAASQKCNSWVHLSNHADAQRTESDSADDSAKDRGDAVTVAADLNEIPVAAGLPGVMAQLAAVSPTGIVTSLGERKNSSDKKAILTASSSSMAKTTAGANDLRNLEAHGAAGTRIPASETTLPPTALSDQMRAECISSSASVGRQNNAVEDSDTNAGRTKTGDSPSAALPENELATNDLKTPEYPVADRTGLKTGMEQMVHSPQPGIISTTDWSAATMMPTPSKTGGWTEAKSKTGDSQSATLPENELATNDLKTPEYAVADRTGLKPGMEQTVHSPQPGIIPTMDWSAATMTPTPSKTGGTPVAKMFLAMDKTVKMNKVAGLTGKTEKVLPDDADSAGPENNLPTADLFARLSSRHESDVLPIGLSNKGTDRLAASVQDCIPISSVVDLRARALERTHDMIALQAVRLADAKLDSLHVVIKPGAGMQLSLEMRQHGDEIAVQAVLQRGDFGPLSQHWSELQQRLEPHGVHLAALVGGDNFTANSSSNGFQSPQHEFTNPDPLEASAFAEFALSSPAIQSPTPALAASVIRHGWETWA
jgi:hypothetical protein